MEFRTELRLGPSIEKINLRQTIVTAGSCFADAIGRKLSENKFGVLANPFGVIYNPVSIHRALRYAADNTMPSEETYLFNQGIYRNYDFHSELSGGSEHDVVNALRHKIEEAHRALRSVSWIMITYGTAWVYERKDNGAIVANCHKIPAAAFTKSLLTVDAIVKSFSTIHEAIKALASDARFILTVSPVRHIKDTLPLNSVSKAVLRLACYQLEQQYPDVSYFPAFEIAIDDLRDYRFYKADMLHPTEIAEDYIWRRFAEAYFDSQALDFLGRWKTLKAALSHRPFHPDSQNHQLFLARTLQQFEELNSSVDVSEEIAVIKAQLK